MSDKVLGGSENAQEALEGQVFLSGEHRPHKEFHMTQKLQDACIAFYHCIKGKVPTAQITLNKTDRDVQIQIINQSPEGLPQIKMYFVWEEDGEILGAEAQ